MDNISLFFLIFSMEHSWLSNNLMLFTTNYLIYISILLIFVLGFKGGIKERKALILIILSIPIAILLIKVIHIFFYEPRPFVTFNFSPLVNENANASFPSRHATIASIIAFSYIFLKSKWAPIFLASALLIGTSRVYLGVHYPLDILGGLITAIISIVIALQVKKLLKIGLLNQKHS